MGNDPILIERLRGLAPLDAVEKNVFGARCWVLAGHLAFGVHDDDLLLRLGDADDAALRPFDPMGSGRPMRGWYLVGQDDVAEDDELQPWIDRAVAFTGSLPPK